jgi:hypothetical protein
VPTAIVLPPLVHANTPNKSSRNGTKVDLLVWHETAGLYHGSVAWLENPAAQASAHLVIDEEGSHATQLVYLAEKAWHAAAYNSRSVGVEHANTTAKGYATDRQLEVSARVFGWLCLHLGVPPRWARGGVGPGVCYHGELGALGGGHYLCGPNPDGWQRFLAMLHNEITRGGYRKEWAL